MSPTLFDWPSLIAGMFDGPSRIPTDVVFQILENDQLHEVKSHKNILGLVSPTFNTMFFTTDVGDKTAKVIKIEKTTAPAFQIMIDAVYNIRSLGDSLEGKSVDEVFDVLNLIERYQIAQLMETAKELLSNYSITDETVLEVAGVAMEHATLFEDEAQHLILRCAKFLLPKLKDRKSMMRYASENLDRKEVFATLLAFMNDIVPSECPNCKYEICQNGNSVQKDDFREGLLVTTSSASGNWGQRIWGTVRISKVGNGHVILEAVRPEQTGGQYGPANSYPKSNTNKQPTFLYSCT